MRRPPLGLTLIELLVTLAVLAILSVMSFRALESMVLSRDRLLGQAFLQRQLAMAFAQIESDLRVFRSLDAAQARQALRFSATAQGWLLVMPGASWEFEADRLVRRSLRGPTVPRLMISGLGDATVSLVLPARQDQVLGAGTPWDWPESTSLAGLKLSLFPSGAAADPTAQEVYRVFLLGLPAGGRR